MILIVISCIFTNAYAQLSTNEQPTSFDTKLNLSVSSKSAVPVVTMPQLDMAKIEQEDKEDEKYDMPPRFGYSHIVNYDLNNSGIWYELPNGDKLWQLNVVCPNALSVNFCYDKFWIPEGGKFFVYSKDKKQYIGAFTSKNNKGNRENVRGFATGLVYGNDVVLEYYQPKEVTIDAIISIEFIVHGYRYINISKASSSLSGNCMVNVNCEEGQNWQYEKNAIALILVNGNRICTGSLINTTDLDQKPYLLTANHCLGGQANNNIEYDAVTSPNLDHYSFYWNYEAPGCINPSIVSFKNTSSAIVLANNKVSDFALLRLTEDPNNLTNYTPYYLGWDCSGQSGDPGVCIHHPQGDYKKISTVAAQPVAGFVSWFVQWKSTENGHGTTEDGSSGSPLLNSEHKVIGQLYGGLSSCNNLEGVDTFRKFDVSWTGNSNDSIQRRLNFWLDSLNIGVQSLEGLLIIPSAQTMTADQQLYSNIRITGSGQLIIQNDIELMGNCSVIVEAGGKLIIDGGTLLNVDLIMKPGSSLQIINNGRIETRNGFDAPLGAVVDISSGKIL